MPPSPSHRPCFPRCSSTRSRPRRGARCTPRQAPPTRRRSAKGPSSKPIASPRSSTKPAIATARPTHFARAGQRESSERAATKKRPRDSHAPSSSAISPRRTPTELGAWLSQLAAAVYRARTVRESARTSSSHCSCASIAGGELALRVGARIDLASILVSTHDFDGAERYLEIARSLAEGDAALAAPPSSPRPSSRAAAATTRGRWIASKSSPSSARPIRPRTHRSPHGARAFPTRLRATRGARSRPSRAPRSWHRRTTSRSRPSGPSSTSSSRSSPATSGRLRKPGREPWSSRATPASPTKSPSTSTSSARPLPPRRAAARVRELPAVDLALRRDLRRSPARAQPLVPRVPRRGHRSQGLHGGRSATPSHSPTRIAIRGTRSTPDTFWRCIHRDRKDASLARAEFGRCRDLASTVGFRLMIDDCTEALGRLG